MGLGIALLWAPPSLAQGGPPAEKPREAAPAPAPSAPFVDRDGDGVHDGMKHRFRRHKRLHGKRHGQDRGRKDGQAQQERPAD